MGVCRTAELLLAASLCVIPMAPVPAAGQPATAEAVLSAARTALGGEERLARTRSLTMRGRTRQNRGDVQVPIEVEIVCQLPDACVRREEYPAQNIEPTALGYQGDTLIQSAVRPPGARLDIGGAHQEFARLLLGAFAGAPTRYALTFTYAGEAEAPEGRADVINITGAGGFSAQFVIHRATHLPVMLLWKGVGAAPQGSAPLPPGGPSAGTLPPASVEHRLYYADYREVQGTKWPFRLRHAVAGTTVDETIFDRIAVNDRVDPRKFEVAK